MLPGESRKPPFTGRSGRLGWSLTHRAGRADDQNSLAHGQTPLFMRRRAALGG
jgi:hypothetical protein